MGFFKKIGKVVKKGLKQVSFKNLVKVGASFDPTGIVGNLQGAHEAKKEAKAYEAQQKRAEAEYMNQLADQQATQAGINAVNYVGTKTNLQSFANGAVGGVGSTVVDATINSWFQKHWQKIALGVGALIGVIFLLRRGGSRSRR